MLLFLQSIRSLPRRSFSDEVDFAPLTISFWTRTRLEEGFDIRRVRIVAHLAVAPESIVNPAM